VFTGRVQVEPCQFNQCTAPSPKNFGNSWRTLCKKAPVIAKNPLRNPRGRLKQNFPPQPMQESANLAGVELKVLDYRVGNE
jgi:hypothetical protein